MAVINRSISWLMIAVLTLVWTLPFGVGAAAAQAGGEPGRRVALVIGNTAYDAVEPLNNAVNDSRAVSESLQELGFEVFEAENIGLQDFEDTVSAFEREAQGAAAAVFFYSGHGFQLGGANYLVPIDAKLSSRDAIAKETLRLDTIISRLQARDRQTLIFLDACRNNPLPEGVRGKDDGDGLAQIETGTGTFVAFATQPGNISRDGDGDNSPFTLALLDHIQTPGISISDMMIRVRNSVEDLTDQTQTPWDQSSLRSQFYFSPEAEAGEALTDEDRDLLLSLDPELRKKFEQRFGIKINEQAEAEEPEELVATIQPRFLISGSSNENETAAAPSPSGSDDVAAAAEAPDAPIVGRFEILKADDGPEVAVLSRDEPIVNADGSIPTPSFRPGDPAEQQVAALAPDAVAGSDDTTAAPPQPSPAAPAVEAPVVEAPAPPQPSTDVASTEAGEGLVVIEAQDEPAFSGPFVPAPVTTSAETAKRSDDGEVRVAAISESEALKGAADGKPIGPVARSIDSIAGEEVSFAPSASPALPSATLAPIATATPADRTMIAPSAPVAQPSVAASSPVDAAAPVQSATPLADSTPSGVVVLGAEPAQPSPGAEAAEEPVVTAVAPSVDAPTTVAPAAVLGAPILIPTPQLTLPVGEAVPVEPEVKTAAVDPEQIRPAAIERSDPVDETPKPKAEAVPLPTEEEEREMARLIQSELTRLGCYRSGVDGDWGSNSARGLLRYFATKKEDPDNLEPNAPLLARLLAEPEVVCKRTEVAPAVAANKPRAPKASVTRSKPVAVSRERPQKPVAGARPSKPKTTASGDAPKRKLSKNLKLGGLR